MKTIDKIPISKISRASKLVSTGAKVGVNFIRYYGDKMVNPKEDAKDRLDQNNAEDIYDSLKQLKGSALKVAQMLSMEKSIMPRAYVEKFSLSQFSVPPLSAPLVVRTFKKYFGKHPEELFDTFNATSVNAASIGQVHIAEKNGKKFAVKIQYPGVAESIASDLALIKPVALKMFNIKAKDSDKYFKEVEDKLTEETNYNLELQQSKAVVEACQHIPHLKFPEYYEELSSERIITMDYMYGEHLSEFVAHNEDADTSNKLGQALWDFYMFQIHKLRKVHADPHPGNFLISAEGDLIALDFGCMKSIPDEFYIPYFELAQKHIIDDPIQFKEKLQQLEIIKETDSEEEITFFSEMFHELLSLFSRPFHAEIFDFSDSTFFDQISEIGQRYSKSTELRNMNADRGSTHFIYINRTFFGLYNLMFDLKAENIKINNFNTL